MIGSRSYKTEFADIDLSQRLFYVDISPKQSQTPKPPSVIGINHSDTFHCFVRIVWIFIYSMLDNNTFD